MIHAACLDPTMQEDDCQLTMRSLAVLRVARAFYDQETIVVLDGLIHLTGETRSDRKQPKKQCSPSMHKHTALVKSF
jgi:hypothetical protein